MANKPAMSQPAASKKPVAAAEKEKAVAFVNWETTQKDSNDRPALRSTKGFALYDNKYATLEEKALVELAKSNGGTALLPVILRIVVAQDKPEKLDISGIQLVK